MAIQLVQENASGTSTERLIYEHLRCTPVGMDDNALAYELAVLIGPTIAPCSEPR